MNLVESVLLENIDKPASLFVFPTDVAASRWADHLLRLRHGGTVAMTKFIAWDTFKQNSVRSKVQGKKSIPSVLRKMFVSALIRENAGLALSDVQDVADSTRPLFVSLIRTEWAQQADSFTGWLTGILPQLGGWFKQTTGLPIAQIAEDAVLRLADNLSGDDRDLFTFAQRYAQFLEKHSLFEPAWETPPFEDTGDECFIFFPECLSDFSEYRDLLAASSHVKTIDVVPAQYPCDTFFYTNSRAEITAAALYILALHKNRGIPWNSISVSIPDEDTYAPYLIRELTNRNIPFIKQSGKPLADYPAGQFFAALAGCASGEFSFSSLTALLLNRHLPWKDGEIIQDLIKFGIKNNCINSWAEEDKNGGEATVNVWEDAFAHPFDGINPQARRFFQDLRWGVSALCGAASFAEIRKQYFAFRERFFDMENCLAETDLILSRSISELMYLVEMEKSYPGVCVPNPYAFFTSYLAEVNYLAQQSSSGVTILPYRTAAPAPFDCHIILGASQNNLQAIFSPLAFLPKNKREKLGLTDNDASLTFINLHRFNSRLPAAFFCSEQTFSGYAIPHSALNMPVKPERNYGAGGEFYTDLYRMESEWYTSLYFSAPDEPELVKLVQDVPSQMHERQKHGFDEWLLRRKYTAINGNTLYHQEDHPLLELIRRRFCRNENYKDKPGVSASSLGLYFQCQLKWIFEKTLELENIEIKTGLMTDNITGQVYHAVLNLFLEALRETGEPISPPPGDDDNTGKQPPALPGSYHRLLAEKVEKVFEYFPCLPKSKKPAMSVLTARLLRAQKALFFSQLENFLAVFISFFAGFRVAASEMSCSEQSSEQGSEQGNYYFNGVIDCILEDVNNNLVIVDFKTKNMPKLSECTGEEDLADFQLPIYLTLAEAAFKKEVHAALFFSIIDAKPEVVFGVIQNVLHGNTIPKKEEDRIMRGSEGFLNIMGELNKKAEQFAKEINHGVFSFLPSRPELCLECEYNRVCRTLYKICQGKDNGN